MMEDYKTKLADKVRNLPQEPGVYRYLDSENKIIYIGKAKSLRNRVSSYFTGKYAGRKTLKLVSEIRDVEFTVVATEFDALLLENNLIKNHQPKYNILLKDDKTYPFICVTNERFPRIFPTRRRQDDGSRYFGPYASVKTMNAILELFRKIYNIRTCTYALTHENVAAKKYKVCLEYHIKNCLGPCEGLQSEEDYNVYIKGAIDILKGNLSVAKNYFKEKMQEAAEKWEFEKAEAYKIKYELVSNFQNKSLVTNPNVTDLEVCTLLMDNSEQVAENAQDEALKGEILKDTDQSFELTEDTAYVNFIKIVNGCITQTESIEIKRKLDETPAEILEYALFDFREKFNTAAPRVLVNIPIQTEIKHVEILVPQRGDMKKLVELSVRNALYFKKDRQASRVEYQKQKNSKSALLQLKADLNLKDLPEHIECFDNSNFQGTDAVSAMVCFKDGKPSKKDYRHYNVKTVEGANDFDTMYEVVTRRYKRLIEEEQPLPQLVVIDGGKGQLNKAHEALRDLGIDGKIAIVGIAKRLEEIYFPADTEPLHLSKKSRSLILLQKLRDEAHRFGITHHRNKRSKTSLKSVLQDIKGIGEETAKLLLLNYRSVAKIQQAEKETLAKLIGKHKAEIIKNFFEAQPNTPKNK
jgi:excinuclease ABC subunit C